MGLIDILQFYLKDENKREQTLQCSIWLLFVLLNIKSPEFLSSKKSVGKKIHFCAWWKEIVQSWSLIWEEQRYVWNKVWEGKILKLSNGVLWEKRFCESFEGVITLTKRLETKNYKFVVFNFRCEIERVGVLECK